MNRRQYLTRTGVPLATLAAMAGCLDDLPGSDSNDDSVAVADRTGDRELDRAVGTLNEAAFGLPVDDEFEDPTAVEFEPTGATELIADARDHLETAATELGDGREGDIELVRTYATVLERLVTVTETVTDERFESDVETAFAAIDGDGDLEAASETIADRTDALAAAETRHAEAAADVEGFDDRFADLTRIDPDRLAEGIARLEGVLAPLVALGDGIESLLDGYEAVDRGRKHMENEAFDRASDAFADAETTLGTATETFAAAEPPNGLAAHVETASCRSEHLTDAAAAFGDWATAADAGNPMAAQTHRENGERALQATRDCPSP